MANTKTHKSFLSGWSLSHPGTRKAAVRGLQFAYIGQGKGYEGKIVRSGVVLAGSVGYHTAKKEYRKRGATTMKMKKSKTGGKAAKGAWAGGKAPAQGGTKKKMSKPEGKKGGLTSAMKKGSKSSGKAGGSPLDGRKRGKK